MKDDTWTDDVLLVDSPVFAVEYLETGHRCTRGRFEMAFGDLWFLESVHSEFEEELRQETQVKRPDAKATSHDMKQCA